MKHTTLSLLGVIAAVTLISVIASQEAYAHGSVKIPLTIANGETRNIQVVLGHTNEPSYGNNPGTWDGVHGVDITVRDADTKLPIKTASLKVDKYFFKNQKKVDKASSPADADVKDFDVPIGAVFGQPGKFLARQMVIDGIYGYRVYGTVTYFDGTNIPVDFTGFCSDASKFNSPGFSGSFGCIQDIEDTKFPGKKHKMKD